MIGDILDGKRIKLGQSRETSRGRVPLQLFADADEALEPSFPLLSIKPSQALDAQTEESRNPEKVEKSFAVFESILGMYESPDNSSPSCLFEEQASMSSSRHEETAKSYSSLFPEGQHNDRNIKPPEGERKDKNVHKQTVNCGSSSSISSNQQCELEDEVFSQVFGMQPMQSRCKKTPLIQVKFLGCPMELVLLCITFPTSVEVHEVKVWASNTELHVEANSFDHVMVRPFFFQ
ncbi:hypothetical protein L7F22_034983 [Adiantum nelumboides]|nr:hypothetical protein [Adiantum nelumboides]